MKTEAVTTNWLENRGFAIVGGVLSLKVSQGMVRVRASAQWYDSIEFWQDPAEDTGEINKVLLVFRFPITRRDIENLLPILQ